MTLMNIPEIPEVITEEELVTALTALHLVDNVVTIDDISELHFTPGQLELVYVKPVREHRVRPLLVHRFIQIVVQQRPGQH
jgi:hypothetical protein